MAEVKNKLEMPWEAGRANGCFCRCPGSEMMVVWNKTVVTGMVRKKTGRRKMRKNRLTGLDLVTGWMGQGGGGRREGKIIYYSQIPEPGN